MRRNLERAALLAMSFGLLCIIQPWVHALFVAGFPLTLAGVIVHDVAAWRSGRDLEERA